MPPPPIPPPPLPTLGSRHGLIRGRAVVSGWERGDGGRGEGRGSEPRLLGIVNGVDDEARSRGRTRINLQNPSQHVYSVHSTTYSALFAHCSKLSCLTVVLAVVDHRPCPPTHSDAVTVRGCALPLGQRFFLTIDRNQVQRVHIDYPRPSPWNPTTVLSIDSIQRLQGVASSNTSSPPSRQLSASFYNTCLHTPRTRSTFDQRRPS